VWWLLGGGGWRVGDGLRGRRRGEAGVHTLLKTLEETKNADSCEHLVWSAL
jgi:hypothetical protein